jgi:predicted nucleic acid-binding protein
LANFVLDASVTVAGLAPDENHVGCVAVIERALAEEAAVPALKVRQSRISRRDYDAIVASLRDLRIVCDLANLENQRTAASEIALRQNLTAYDAAYLELAAPLDLPLATLDRRLATEAIRAGVSLVRLDDI